MLRLVVLHKDFDHSSTSQRLCQAEYVSCPVSSQLPPPACPRKNVNQESLPQVLFDKSCLSPLSPPVLHSPCFHGFCGRGKRGSRGEGLIRAGRWRSYPCEGCVGMSLRLICFLQSPKLFCCFVPYFLKMERAAKCLM